MFIMFGNIILNLLISVARSIHNWPTLSVLQSLGGNLRGFHMTLDATWHVMKITSIDIAQKI
jgi:hypothetical protein